MNEYDYDKRILKTLATLERGWKITFPSLGETGNEGNAEALGRCRPPVHGVPEILLTLELYEHQEATKHSLVALRGAGLIQSTRAHFRLPGCDYAGTFRCDDGSEWKIFSDDDAGGIAAIRDGDNPAAIRQLPSMVWYRLTEKGWDKVQEWEAGSSSKPGDGVGMLSSRELAQMHGVSPNALRKRLDRYRQSHLDGYIENTERQNSRDPRFLYAPKVVAPIIESLKQVESKRPANVQRQ